MVVKRLDIGNTIVYTGITMKERDTEILPVRIKKELYNQIDQAVKRSRQPSRNAWMNWLIKEGLRSHQGKGG